MRTEDGESIGMDQRSLPPALQPPEAMGCNSRRARRRPRSHRQRRDNWPGLQSSEWARQPGMRSIEEVEDSRDTRISRRSSAAQVYPGLPLATPTRPTGSRLFATRSTEVSAHPRHRHQLCGYDHAERNLVVAEHSSMPVGEDRINPPALSMCATGINGSITCASATTRSVAVSSGEQYALDNICQRCIV